VKSNVSEEQLQYIFNENDILTLKMESACFSKMLSIYNTAWFLNPEDYILD
jgi:hypothetical protein